MGPPAAEGENGVGLGGRSLSWPSALDVHGFGWRQLCVDPSLRVWCMALADNATDIPFARTTVCRIYVSWFGDSGPRTLTASVYSLHIPLFVFPSVNCANAILFRVSVALVSVLKTYRFLSTFSLYTYSNGSANLSANHTRPRKHAITFQDL